MPTTAQTTASSGVLKPPRPTPQERLPVPFVLICMTEDLLRWPPGHRFGRDSSVTWAPMGQEPFHLSSRRREFSGNRLPGRRLRARVRKDLRINDLLAPAINKNDENTAAGLQTWWPRCQQRRYLTSR